MNGLSAGCCCGCEIFSIPNLMSAGAPITEVDGFRVVNSQLPGGLFYLILDPRVTGQFSASQPYAEFRLLKDDDSVFASWKLYRWTESPSMINFRRWVFEWDGEVIEDTTGGTANFPHHIAVRKECSSLFVNTIVPSPLSQTPPAFRDSNFIPAYTQSTVIYGTDNFFFPSRIGLLGPQLNVPELDSSSFHSFARGVPLPNRASSLEATSLRLAVKFYPTDPSNTFTVSASAFRLQQEQIECSEYSLEEKNPDCLSPRICPVTAPHYTTPIWDVESVSGDITFSNQFAGCSTYENCTAAVQYGEIATQAAPTRFFDTPVPNSFMGNDLRQFTYSFDDNSQAIVDSAYTFRNVDGNPVGGNTTNFRTANFPFQVCTEIFATSNPCEWRIRAHFGFWAWCIGANVTSLAVLSGQRTTGSHNGVNYFLIFSPQMNIGNNQGRLSPRWQMSVCSYERTVPAWTATPPVLSFDASHLMPGFETAAFFVVAQLSNVNNLSFVNCTPIRVAATSIAFTLAPFDTPRVPYPKL
jgi:hypothetical protein